MITLDFETYYSTEYSLSKITTEAYIRDARFETIGVGTRIDDAEPVWVSGDAVEPHLRSLDIPKQNMLCHHTAFDGAILHWRYGLKPKAYLDTLSMSRPVTGLTVGGSLKALAKKFCLGEKGEEVHAARGKRLADFSAQELAAYGEYCKNDVVLTYLLYQILRQFSTPQEHYVIDMMLRMFIDPVLGLDDSILRSHHAKVLARKVTLMAKIDQSIGRDALMSNPQFAAVLEKLGVDPPMKVSPKTGKLSYAFAKTDVAFKELLEHEDDKVQTVVAARLGIKSTLEETRTQKFIEIAGRGTLPIMLNYYGAHTGRASGGDKINPQNMTRGSQLRYSILPPPGHAVIAGDSSQIEARILAWFAGEFELVSDFRNTVDVYSKFAASVYEHPVDKSMPDKRFLGKTCILGLGYMTGWAKLQKTLKIGQHPVTVSDDEARHIVILYRTSMPMIVNLWELADQALNQMVRGYEYELGVHLKLHCTQEGVQLPNGMMLRYPNLRRTKQGIVYDSRRGPVYIYSGKLVENVVQALARIVVFTQTAKLDQWLRTKDTVEYRHKLAHSVHDEIVVVAPGHDAPAVVDRMKKEMSTAPKWAGTLPVACEVRMGKSYGHCK